MSHSQPTVSANGLTLVHAASGGRLLTTDICNTTVGSSVIPIPYTNLAHSEDAAATATSVFVGGHPLCVESSCFATSYGDESGDRGGIVSGTQQGEATFLGGSPDVFVEGVPVVRAFEQMVSNSDNTAPAPLIQALAVPPQLAAYDPLPAEQPCPVTAVGIVGNAQAPLPGALLFEGEPTSDDDSAPSWQRERPLCWAFGGAEGGWLVAAVELPEQTETVRLSWSDRDRRYGKLTVPLSLGAQQAAWVPDSAMSAAVGDGATANGAAEGEAGGSGAGAGSGPGKDQGSESGAGQGADQNTGNGEETESPDPAAETAPPPVPGALVAEAAAPLSLPTVLVPTLLRTNGGGEAGRRSGGHGYGGWVYLFWQQGGTRALWRELWLDEHGMAHEVNLAYERGDERRASGEGRAVVMLPQRLAGEPVLLEALYSPVQWSWAQVLSFGGLHPDDPRAEGHTAPDAVPQAGGPEPAATADRPPPGDAKRLLRIDLSAALGEEPSVTALSGPGLLARADEFVDADPESGEPDPVREDLLPYAESGIPVLYLDDPLGEARRLARAQVARHTELEAWVTALQTGCAPESFVGDDANANANANATVTATATATATADGDRCGDVTAAAVPGADVSAAAETSTTATTTTAAACEEPVLALHELAAAFYRLAFIDGAVGFGERPPDRLLLEHLLAVGPRAELRAEIIALRRQRLALLSSERYAAALNDYLDNTPRRRLSGVAALLHHCYELAEPAAAADGYLLSADEQRIDVDDLQRARALLCSLLPHQPSPRSRVARSATRPTAIVRPAPLAVDLPLSAVAQRLLSGSLAGAGGSAGGPCVPRRVQAERALCAQAPAPLQPLEEALMLADAPRVVTAKEGLSLAWKLVRVLAQPVSYDYQVINILPKLIGEMELPGSERLGPLAVTEQLLPEPQIAGETLRAWQYRFDDLTGGITADNNSRVSAIPAQDGHTALFTGDGGQQLLFVIGDPRAGKRAPPPQRFQRLVLAREPGSRLSDVAERFANGTVGQSVRALFATYELLTLQNALREGADQDGFAHLLTALAAASGSTALIAEIVAGEQQRRWGPAHPRVRWWRTLARQAGNSASGVGLVLALNDGRDALQDSDYSAAAAALAGSALTVASMVLFHLGRGLLGGKVGLAAAVVLIAYELLRDGPLGELYRHGPFRAQVRFLLQAHYRVADLRDIPCHRLLRDYAEHGPMVAGRNRKEAWHSWSAIDAVLDSVLLAPVPVLQVEPHYRRTQGRFSRLSGIDLHLSPPAFDWRSADAIEQRFYWRDRQGRTSVWEVPPAVLVKLSADAAKAVITLTLEMRNLQWPGHATTILIMLRQRGPLGDAPQPDAQQRPRYWVAMVATRGRARTTQQVLTATMEEVLSHEPY